MRFSSLSPHDQNNVNMDTFITFFETIHSAKTITTNLANHFFKYAITKNNPNFNCHKSDPFIYIILEKYTSDKFYKVMIDTRASK